nr:MAG TPA: hypothetical protein [Caudoviricetes sp.]
MSSPPLLSPPARGGNTGPFSFEIVNPLARSHFNAAGDDDGAHICR